jgi:hypothetical protein
MMGVTLANKFAFAYKEDENTIEEAKMHMDYTMRENGWGRVTEFEVYTSGMTGDWEGVVPEGFFALGCVGLPGGAFN